MFVGCIYQKYLEGGNPVFFLGSTFEEIADKLVKELIDMEHVQYWINNDDLDQDLCHQNWVTFKAEPLTESRLDEFISKRQDSWLHENWDYSINEVKVEI